MIYWSVKFHKNQTYCNFETKSSQVFNFGSRSAISNIIFMINELDMLRMPNFIALGIYFIFGPNLPGMRGLILVLMWNVCYLAVILILLVVAWWLLLITKWLLLVTAHYLVVTGGYCSLLFVPNFSMTSFFLCLASNLCLVRLLQSQHKRGVSVLKVFSSNDLMVLFYIVYLSFILDLRRDNSKHNSAYFKL